MKIINFLRTSAHSLFSFFKKQGIIVLILICVAIVVFTGCMSITQSIMGIHTPKPLSNNEIQTASKRLNIDQNHNYR